MTAEELLKTLSGTGSNSQVEALKKLLTDATQLTTTVKDVTIKREGAEIVIPPNMSLDEVSEWCKRKKDEEEREVTVYHELHYSPLDGAVAFHKALAKKYGWAQLVPTPGFFGPNPPTMIGVPVGTNEKIQVPWGRVQVPGIAGYLQTGMATEPTPRFIINGKVKQKHAQAIKEVVDLTEKFLREESIYKGKAVKISFEWQRKGLNFDPSVHCPQFMPLDGREGDLIFGAEVQNAINLGLFTPIEQSAACRKYGVPLKRGILLHGEYGTGKTLCANITATKAVKNKWTFVYLDNVLDLKKGLQFAAQYAPCVLFSEDIDRVITGERTLDMDEVLNTLDGVDTKGQEIITVFTTNHVEDINPAILRMGRLDTLVEIKKPDAEAAVRLVKLYGRGLLARDMNFEVIGETLKDHIPAFIRETVERAKIAAISRTNGGEINGDVREEDLLAAAKAMADHAAMLEVKDDKEELGTRVLVEVPGSQRSRKVRDLLVQLNGDGEE